jgi:hypothetical protein
VTLPTLSMNGSGVVRELDDIPVGVGDLDADVVRTIHPFELGNAAIAEVLPEIACCGTVGQAAAEMHGGYPFTGQRFAPDEREHEVVAKVDADAPRLWFCDPIKAKRLEIEPAGAIGVSNCEREVRDQHAASVFS